ncbi:MAG: bepA [Cyanobacteria bacterium RYN_339]|nr:bepA [Cyanobacteria bacterium RYN_339]
MALENVIARKLAPGFKKPVFERGAKAIFKPAMIETADKLATTATGGIPELLAKVQAAAKGFDGHVVANMPGVMAGGNHVAGLQQLYTQLADKAVATIDPQLDEQLGKLQLAALTEKAHLLPDDHPLTSYLQGVVDRTAGPDAKYPFKVHVLETDEANAFNAGGSTMVVYTGLFKTVKSEAELAGILGHEMTHGDNRHVMKKVVSQSFSATADAWHSAQHPLVQGEGFFGKAKALIQNTKTSAQLIAFKENNFEAVRNMQRGLEAEADAGGARRMAGAGYDPHGLSAWFQRMEGEEKQGSHGLNGLLSGFMNDHPTSVQRVAAVEGQIKQEGLDRTAKETGVAPYLAATQAYQPVPKTA